MSIYSTTSVKPLTHANSPLVIDGSEGWKSLTLEVDSTSSTNVTLTGNISTTIGGITPGSVDIVPGGGFSIGMGGNNISGITITIPVGCTANLIVGKSNGTGFGVSRLQRIPVVAVPILTFQTNAVGLFNPSMTVTSGTLTWDMGDGTTQNTNSPSITYPDSSLKTIKVFLGTATIADITGLLFSSQFIVGSIDISQLTALTDIELDSNADLTSITNPVTAALVTVYNVSGSNLMGILDLLGLTGLGGSFNVNSNPLLTSITNPTSSQVFTQYNARSCNLTGTLNLSGLTGLGGDFEVNNNPLLTSITNPTSSQVFTVYYAFSCGLTSLNLSSLSHIGGDIRAYLNTGMVTFTLPVLAQQILKIDVHNNALNLTSANALFSRLNVWFTAHAPSANGTYIENGGTNTQPTGGAANTDIVSIKAKFISAGHSATITIN